MKWRVIVRFSGPKVKKYNKIKKLLSECGIEKKGSEIRTWEGAAVPCNEAAKTLGELLQMLASKEVESVIVFIDRAD